MPSAGVTNISSSTNSRTRTDAELKFCFRSLPPTTDLEIGKALDSGPDHSFLSAIQSKRSTVFAALTLRPTIFRELIKAQEGGAVIEVTANFRSQSAIITHVNACFQQVFGQGSQPSMLPLTPTVADRSYPVPCVTRLPVHLETEGRIYADALRDAEAEQVADTCAKLIGTVMIERADGTRTPLRAGDIALLSPTHTELWRYERALEQCGLAVAPQAGRGLMRRQETQDALALLRVLANSSDTLAFGALMRGPLVGLTEQELLDITAALAPVGGRPASLTSGPIPNLCNIPLQRTYSKSCRSEAPRCCVHAEPYLG